MTAVSLGYQRDPAWQLFSCGHAEVSDFAVFHLGGTSFVDGELTGNLVPIPLHKSVHPSGRAGLLAGFRQKKNVPRQSLPAAVQLKHGLEMRGKRALIVGSATAVKRSVANLRSEGINAPMRPVHRNHVLVREQEYRPFRASPLQTSHNTCAARHRLKNLVWNAFPLEDLREVHRHFGLIARRIPRIHLHEVLQKGICLLSRSLW